MAPNAIHSELSNIGAAVRRTAYTLAYLCHALAGGLVYATNSYWCGVPLELISRGLLWSSADGIGPRREQEI